MGFPVSYPELPSRLLQVLCLLGYVRRLISVAFIYLGLGDLVEPETPWAEAPERAPREAMIDEALPLVRFADLERRPDRCAVCLHEFEGAVEVRRLRNCCHVFHRCCLDPWIQHGQSTCPLCRAPLFAKEVPASLDDNPWIDASGDVLDLFADYPTALVASDQILL